MSDDVPTLEGAQAALRSAFFAHESGLFVLNCVPGFGKSLTVERIAGELYVRLYEAGVRCPERYLCIASFSRDDAASLEPGIRDALDAFAANDVNTEVTIDDATAEHLKGRLRHADHLGTIDSVLRTVFADIATELGFDGMPSVGNDALQTTLTEDCLNTLRNDPAHAGTFATLDRAYPGDDGDSVDALLEAMRNERRSRRLSHDAFRTGLRDTVNEVYPSGKPESFDDIRDDIASFYDADTAAEFATEHASDSTDSDSGDSDTTEAEDIVEADKRCHDEWQRCIDLLCELLKAYEAVYDQECRERGILAYTDVAYWIAEFFESPPEKFASGDPAVTRDFRDRLSDRYARQFQAILLDEAQDVSIVQHDALAQLVPDDARILLSADADQCIYEWRKAQPSLFQQALENGSYFGRDWVNHVTEKTAATSYRMRPDIAHCVNQVFSTVFTTQDYGHESGTQTTIEPVRSSSDASNVHVVNSTPSVTPSSDEWTEREATPLSNFVRGCIANGTLDLQETDAEPLTVLFRTRRNMDTFADAFRAHGFSVANGSNRLFTEPIVEVICAVVSWLVNPHDPDRIQTLLDDDSIPLSDALDDDTQLVEILTETTGPVDDIAALKSEVEADSHRKIVGRLAKLASRQPRLEADPGVHVIKEIIETLGLQTDPFEQTDDERQRLATLDALIDAVNDWEGDDRYSISELADILARYRASPAKGPNPPVANPDAYDIVFRTCHDMKGDESAAVCIADATEAIDNMGPTDDTFCARGDTLALAPPATVTRTPVKTQERRNGEPAQCGLRWSADYQVDDQSAGPPPLTRMQARHRAEQWRLLYVAMTRARDDLILSLPHTTALDEADSWTATIRALFGLSDQASRGTHTCSPKNTPKQTFSYGVNDVPFGKHTLETHQSRHRAGQEATPVQTGWTPKHVNGSQLHLLLANPDQYRLDYLRNRSLHTETTHHDQASELALDAVDPDIVGQIAHDVLAAAVVDRVTTAELRACCPNLQNRLDASLDEYASTAPQADREKIRTFVANEICPQFADTAAWDRLQDADCHYVEDNLSSILDNGLETETHNRADIVSVDADGSWHVDDLKLLLTSPEPTRRKRYAVQAEFYALLLERQLPSEADVTPWVTHLGADTGTTKAEQKIMDLEEWIERNL